MKKIGALLSSVVLIIALIVPLNASAAGASASLSGPSSAAPGKTISVTFSLGASDSYGVQANVSYDSSKLEYIGSSKTIGGSWILSNNGTSLVFEDTTASNPINSTRSMARLKFRVKSNATPSSTYSVSISGKASNGGTFSSSYTGKVGQPASSGGSSSSKTTKAKSNSKLTTKQETTEAETKEVSSKLSNISVEGFVLSPKFDPDKKEYIVWLPFETKDINVTATPEDGVSKVEIKGNKDLKPGKENIVKIVCTTENGDEKTYTIKAMRAPASGIYGTQAKEAMSNNNTKTGMPVWLIIVMCVGCALLGFILALIISSIKRRRNEGKYDSYQGLGINLFDEDDDNDQPEQKSTQPKFRGISFDKKPRSQKGNSRIAKDKNKQKMYINPQGNKVESGSNNNVQRPVQPPVQRPVQPPVQKPVQPPVQKSVQPPVQRPVQPPVQRPVQPPVQKPVQPPVQRPVQPSVQRPVQPPVQKPVQPPVQRPVQPSVQKPVQPPVQKPVQPTIEKPVQPMSSAPISKEKVGDKLKDIKPTSSASDQDFSKQDKAETMKLPYTAAGSTHVESKVEKRSNRPAKRMPRNPFEQSADD